MKPLKDCGVLIIRNEVDISKNERKRERERERRVTDGES